MISDYGIRVMVNATAITNESTDVDPSDFDGDGFIVASRIEAVRETIMNDPKYDRRIEDVLKAMEIVDMEIMMAARFFAAMNFVNDQKKGR